MRNVVKNFFMELIKLTLLGVFVSVLIALYRYASHFIINISNQLFLSNDVYTKTFSIILAIGLIFLSYVIIRLEGSVQSGGLAQLKLMLSNKNIKFRYYFAIPLMFFNSLISFFVGAPLGSEAPAVFMGGSSAYGLNKLFKDENDDAYLGMAVAFSCAFNAPLSGFLYGFEECLHSIKIKNIFKMIYLICLSYGISLLIIPEPIFYFKVTSEFDFTQIYSFIFVIAINFILAFLILFFVPRLKIFLDSHYSNFIIKYRFFILAFLSLIILTTYPILSGNGTNLINYVLDDPLLWMIVLFLIVRLILFIFSANFMMTGGLVLPALALGALSGYIAFSLAQFCFNIPADYLSLFIIVSMCCLFSCVNEAPLTGIALCISFTNYENILTTLAASFASIIICFVLIKLCRLDDINDSRFKLLKTSRKN